MTWSAVFPTGLAWAVADHLWQSTVCVAAVTLAAWIAGPQRPAVRHALWLAASIKFLVPFSLVLAAGEELAPVLTPLGVRSPSVDFHIVAEPFTLWAQAAAVSTGSAAPMFPLSHVLAIGLVSVWATGAVAILAARWRRWQHIRSIVSRSVPLTTGREVEAARRVAARRIPARVSLPVRQIADASAPALFGIRRAVLLWPAGLSTRLRDHEIEAVMAHEIAHLRRRDNLAALAHTVVEAVFWFHPVVWWMSGRLVHERECACDQEALDAGVTSDTYADTLMTVCRFGLALPLPQPIAASALGSSLGQRVEAIMTYRPISLARPRGLAAALALGMILGPLAVGAGRAQARDAGLPADPVPSPPIPPLTTAAPALAERTNHETTAPASSSASRTDSSRDALRPQQTSRRSGIRAIRQVQPTYTPEALRAGIEGSVELEVLITPDGTVSDVRVVKSLDRQFGLDEQAIRTARLWRFAPPIDPQGRSVQAVVTLILDFRLPDQAGQTPPRDPRPATPSEEDAEFRRGALAPGTPDLVPAKPTSQVQPTYTSGAMRAKTQGSVEVEIVVGSDGTVERARVVGGFLVGPPEQVEALQQQALTAVRRWRFDPARLNDTPVAMWMRAVMDFKLY